MQSGLQSPGQKLHPFDRQLAPQRFTRMPFNLRLRQRRDHQPTEQPRAAPAQHQPCKSTNPGVVLDGLQHAAPILLSYQRNGTVPALTQAGKKTQKRKPGVELLRTPGLTADTTVFRHLFALGRGSSQAQEARDCLQGLPWRRSHVMRHCLPFIALIAPFGGCLSRSGASKIANPSASSNSF